MANKLVFAISLIISIPVILTVAQRENTRREKRFFFHPFLVSYVAGVSTNLVNKSGISESVEKPTLIEKITRKTDNSIIQSAMNVAESSMVAMIEYGVKPLDALMDQSQSIGKKMTAEDAKRILQIMKGILSNVRAKLEVALEAIYSVLPLASHTISDLLDQLIEGVQANKKEVGDLLSMTSKSLAHLKR